MTCVSGPAAMGMPTEPSSDRRGPALEEPAPAPRSARVVAFGLVVLMAAGSIVMWAGVPTFLLWLASQLTESSRPNFGLYVLVLVAMPVTMLLVGICLGCLDRLYGQVMGTVPARRVETPWLHPLRGRRQIERQPTVLAPILTASVMLVLVLALIWFFFYARGGGLAPLP